MAATWPSTPLAGLSACLWDKSRFLRPIHSSWVHSLDASWAFGRDTDLDASWASGGGGMDTIWTLPAFGDTALRSAG